MVGGGMVGGGPGGTDCIPTTGGGGICRVNEGGGGLTLGATFSNPISSHGSGKNSGAAYCT